MSWHSIFSGEHALRWAHPANQPAEGAYSLRLLDRLGYSIEARLSGSHTWKGLATRIFGPQHHLASFFIDGTGPVGHRPVYERDRLLMDDLVNTMTAAPAGGHVYIQELLSTHWNYEWPPDHPVPFTVYAPTVDFLRMNYTPEAVELVWRRYLNAVAWVDRLFGEFTDALKRLDRYDDSFIVVLGDHGEDFHEEGGWAHGSRLCEHQTAVPILIKWPRRLGPMPARRFLGHVDVMPTILGALGVDPLLLGPLEGVPLSRPRESLFVSTTVASPWWAGMLFVNAEMRVEAAYWSSRSGEPPDRLRIYDARVLADGAPVSRPRGLSDAEFLRRHFPDVIHQLFSSID